MNIILFEEKVNFIAKNDDRAKHILKVLRLNVGDEFKAGIVNSNEMLCRITKIDDEGIYFESEDKDDSSALYPLTLALAEVRPICMRRILREVVTLGVSKIILFISDLGEKSYSDSSLYRDGEYKKILLDGAMQSGSTGVSEVIFKKSVDETLKELKEDNIILLDNISGKERLSRAKLEGSVALIIGPERGFSERERSLMLKSGIKPYLIGNRILRTETACVAGVATALSAMDIL